MILITIIIELSLSSNLKCVRLIVFLFKLKMYIFNFIIYYLLSLQINEEI